MSAKEPFGTESTNPTLFGEVPANEVDNNSTIMRLSKSSIISDDRDGIQVSDLDEDSDENSEHVKQKNNLNLQKSHDVPLKENNHIIKDSVAVIDIDDDGE